MEVIPLDPVIGPVNTGKYRHGDSNPGTNPASRVDRNCVLMHPTDQLTRRVRLPLVRLPHEWHDDSFERRAVCVPGNAGKSYPPTPPKPADVLLILDALYTPETHSMGKWASKWGPIGLRNRALIVTLWRSGLRIHEALLLKPVDIDFENCMVTVRRGKGGKRGISGIDRQALDEIQEWLDVRAGLGFGPDDFVFCVVEGPTKGGRLSQGYVRKRLHAAARQAGVLTRTTPHQLRHAMASEWAREGTPLVFISRQLRHSNVATTATYLASIAPEEVLAVAKARPWS